MNMADMGCRMDAIASTAVGSTSTTSIIARAHQQIPS
jgi:hypothetical protein